MFHRSAVKVLALNMLALLSIWPEDHDCLIITSVLAGDKKFKTISFDTKLIKPLMFEKEMPLTEFRRHTTMRAPKFDIDINIPIKLPVEDEYVKEEPRKPVVSSFSLQTGEIHEPSYPSKSKVPKKYYAHQQEPVYAASTVGMHNQRKLIPEPKIYTPQEHQVQIRQHKPDVLSNRQSDESDLKTRLADAYPEAGSGADQMDQDSLVQRQQQQQAAEAAPSAESSESTETMDQSDQVRDEFRYPQEIAQETAVQEASYAEQPTSRGYDSPYQSHNNYQPEFVPGGYVNLQLSGPSGGPKFTYEDYDRERWAQQLSQALGAMPYPILNYQQLQNFYGGLGTFTNGLAENRYEPTSLIEKLKSGFSHLTSKFSRSSEKSDA